MFNLLEFKELCEKGIVLEKMVHYAKDLKTPTVCKDSASKDSSARHNELKIVYRVGIPLDLVGKFNIKPEHVAEEDLGCLLALYGSEPAGCALINLNGRGALLHPFRHEFHFGERRAYLHNIFVDQRFRSRGIARSLYLKSFNLLKNDYSHIDILVDSDKFAPNSIVKKLGFEEKHKVVLIKLFSLKIVLHLNNALKNAIYDLLMFVGKCFIRFIKLLVKPIYSLYIKAIRLREKRFLDMHTLADLKFVKTEGLKIAFICSDKPDQTIINTIYPDGHIINKIKRFHKNNLLLEADKISGGMDAVIIDCPFDWLRRKFSKSENMIFMPKWVNQKNYLFTSFSDFKKTCTKSKNRTAYTDIKKIAKYSYDYIFTKDRKMLQFFYENMYLPYAKNRYKDAALIKSFGSIKESFEKGGLLFVRDKDRYLSGVVIKLVDHVMEGVSFGILNGDSGLIKSGALIALYHSYFKFAEKNGIKAIDFGLSRSFLHDGVLRYKAKWNAEIEFDKKKSSVFAIKFRNISPSLKRFLISNPFMAIEKNKLVGNIFVDSQETLDRDEVIRPHSINGLSEYKVIKL